MTEQMQQPKLRCNCTRIQRHPPDTSIGVTMPTKFGSFLAWWPCPFWKLSRTCLATRRLSAEMLELRGHESHKSCLKPPAIINAHKVVEHPDLALECLGCRRLIRAHKGYINASYFRRVRCTACCRHWMTRSGAVCRQKKLIRLSVVTHNM